MEINYHFGFSKKHHPQLIKYILDHDILFDGSDDDDSVGVDIYASNLYWPMLEEILKSDRIPYVGEMIFNKKELLAAEWMIVRSKWSYGWSEPQKDFPFSHITFSDEEACGKCYYGLIQRAPFQIKKAPSWGRRNFFSLFDKRDTLFVSDKARSVFEKENICGIEFSEVRNKNGNSKLSNINQLVISTVLPEGFVASNMSYCKVYRCPECGKKRYFVPGTEKKVFERGIFGDAPDIVKSGDLFGETVGVPCILIRQKVYRVLVDNKLDRNLIFYPIDLV